MMATIAKHVVFRNQNLLLSFFHKQGHQQFQHCSKCFYSASPKSASLSETGQSTYRRSFRLFLALFGGAGSLFTIHKYCCTSASTKTEANWLEKYVINSDIYSKICNWNVIAAEKFKEPNYPIGERAKHHNFIADVVEKVSPAVVYLEIKGRHPFTSTWIPTTAGSGFIVHEDGVVLTNAHVVANTTHIDVKLNDGRTFQGVVEYVDPVSDLATVRINGEGKLPVLPLGDSSKSRPGEWVAAMGSPLSLSNTITAGVISSVGRGSQELGLHHKDMSYIQTDAAITIGNSGGPLINLDGEAIGINTMTATAGISFAIPSNHAKNFLDQVQKMEERKGHKGWFGFGGGNKENLQGKASSSNRKYIGITMLTLNSEITEAIRWRHPEFPDVSSGVMVQRVTHNSPAHKAGIRCGDVIVKIDKQSCTNSGDVYKALQSTGRLNIQVLRGSQTLNFTITAENIG